MDFAKLMDGLAQQRPSKIIMINHPDSNRPRQPRDLHRVWRALGERSDGRIPNQQRTAHSMVLLFYAHVTFASQKQTVPGTDDVPTLDLETLE